MFMEQLARDLTHCKHSVERWGFQGGARGKEPAATAGRMRRRLDPWAGKIPWRGNGNPFQYSCLENPMDWGAWQPTVHGATKSWTWLERLNKDNKQWMLAFKTVPQVRERYQESVIPDDSALGYGCGVKLYCELLNLRVD